MTARRQAIRRFVHLVLFARTFWQLVLLKTKPEWLIRRYGLIPIEEAPLSWQMAQRKMRAFLPVRGTQTGMLTKYIYQKSGKDADLDKIKEEYEPLSKILV